MTQTISRLYSSAANAEAAVAELESSGFGPDAISVVAPTQPAATAEPAATPHEPAAAAAEPGETADDPIIAAITQAGVPAPHAAVYAQAVHRGETLVCVRPPFGFAHKAATILDQFSPTETDLPEYVPEVPAVDPAAPLSAAMGWRVLSHDPTPLSSFLRWPTLSTKRSPPKPDQELVDNPAPFSRSIGLPVLSDKPTIMSTRFGWRLLLDNPTPLSTRLGWPTLSSKQTPPTTRLGFGLLSDNPAPLSSLFGWRLLSNNPAPLSKRFGWRVLSSDPKPDAGKGSSWFNRLMP